jgi:hypothetical protein
MSTAEILAAAREQKPPGEPADAKTSVVKDESPKPAAKIGPKKMSTAEILAYCRKNVEPSGD